MHIFIKIILTTIAIIFHSTAIASATTTEAPSTTTEPVMTFQVIQSQLVIDDAMIESATIITPKNAADSYGVQLKLKNTAAKELTRLSDENIGKKMNIIINDVVTSSPTIRSHLGAEFRLFGLTKAQAEHFINK